MIILIPSYEPDQRLVDLVDHLLAADPDQRIVVVDDGSPPDYRSLFERVRQRGCDVLRHAINRGKGAALKTGFDHIAWTYPSHDVVCADCDGQHRSHDIGSVAAELARDHSGLDPKLDAPIVLGSRSFTGDVPSRSRFGNATTCKVFAAITGVKLADTQTGLRGYRHDLLDWLMTIEGDRFEYEMNVLLEATSDRIEISEVPIETVYLDHNSSSHFRPVADSARIYAPLLRFAGSSLVSSAVDIASFLLLIWIGSGLAIAVVASRVLSAIVNYRINRDMVFERGGGLRSAIRYAALAALILTANYYLVGVLIESFSVPTLAAKVITDLTLFSASFIIQRRFVFAGGRRLASQNPGTDTSLSDRLEGLEVMARRDAS